ncbi:G-type lectin S-receptor-like serine/threonine-protein kinase [Tanacetum coccineum]|uniref:G-type lectin S-receptor-like serine/threonine-protein kinase n=1 Tax=Tanacetum coccineum TaxID=301880 RepID=A0ABQ5H9R1_9ASTR
MITLIIFTILCTHLIIYSFPANGVSMIKLGDQLNFTSQLLSPNSTFTLGFFTIPATSYAYLGIWYTNDAELRRVWVANPSIPIISNSSFLMINPDNGKLIITTRETTLVNISDNLAGSSTNLTATLEDNGNFVLKSETSDQTIWQSFDHPTNVLLPGMKLGSDLETGKTWNLTSWLSDEILDSGAFSLSWEPNGENSQRFMVRRRGQPYWTSGNLQNQEFEFMNVNNLLNSRYNLNYVFNNKESPMSGDFAPGITSSSFDDNSSLSIGDCMVKCWNDCGCLGFITGGNGSGCVTWTGNKSISNFTIDARGNSVSKYVLIFHNLDKEAIQERDDRHFLELMASDNLNNSSDIGMHGRTDSHDMMVFSFTSLVAATNEFSLKNKLGQGGFGPVYKGKLSDDTEIAIKRLSRTSGQGLEEFKNELILIAKLQHTNLVRVLGCCIHEEEKIGYMSPEYAMEGNFSEKSDVFSFGVLILEIVIGRKNSSFSLVDKALNLVSYAWELWKQGNALELMDPTLADTCVIDQLLRTIHVALLCVQDRAVDRPMMPGVISMLNNEHMSLPSPKRSAFFFGESASSSTSVERILEDYSINGVTITEMQVR